MLSLRTCPGFDISCNPENSINPKLLFLVVKRTKIVLAQHANFDFSLLLGGAKKMLTK